MKTTPNEADLKKLPHLFQIRFAVFCAKQVLHLVLEKDKAVCEAAISAAEGFIDGTTTKEQCLTAAYAAAHAAANSAHAATYAAHAAAHAAAQAAHAAANAAQAAYTAANSAHAATYAAYAAANAAQVAKNKEVLIKEQWDYYNELLNFDLNFEKIVLT